jgi:3-phenylpropionate/cinnamic acid dioxygenase small subunit
MAGSPSWRIAAPIAASSSASAIAGERIAVRANYLVVQSTSDDLAKIASAGKYRDTLVRERGLLRFAEKLSIFDSLLIPNSIIHPI